MAKSFREMRSDCSDGRRTARVILIHVVAIAVFAGISCPPPAAARKDDCTLKCPPPLPISPGVFVNNRFYATLQAAIDDVPSGATLALQTGIYVETLRIAGKQLRIIGKGATGDDRTEVHGVDPERGVVTYSGSGGGELKDLAIKRGGAAIVGESDGSLMPALAVKNVVITDTAIGAFGQFSDLLLKDSDISDLTAFGIVTLDVPRLQLLGINLLRLQGAGILVVNDTDGGEIVIENTESSLNALGGLEVQGRAGSVSIRNSNFLGNQRCGICLFNATNVAIDNCQMNETEPLDGRFGDGVLAILSENVTVENSILFANQRVGIASFGSLVVLRNDFFLDNAIDLNKETFEGVPGGFTSLGGLQCFTGDAEHTCQALSSVIEPPTPSTPPISP